MGSSSMENCSQNGTSNDYTYQDLRLRRPDFYPCTDCGRKFTLRAMQIHKRSCSETEDCVCLVCKSGSVKKEKLEINLESKDTISLADLALENVSMKPRLRDLLTGKIQGSRNGTISKSSDKFITFTILDENCRAIEKIVAENKSEKKFDNLNKLYKNPAFDSIASGETSENSNPGAESAEILQNKLLPSAKQTEKCEDHDGEPCNRKLFCCVCNAHIFWESFGLHVIQHCKTVENNYLKCPECSKSYSKPALFLIHFYVHASSHPIDCSDCCCGNPKCIDAASRTISEHCYAESVSYKCYICLNRFSHGQTIVNHMRLHSKEMPFTCTECNRSFRQIGNLQRHMTTHRGDRPHKCPNCCRSFADPATLRNHVRVHTGETPFVCSICTRGFTQIGNLKRHMALHLQKDASSTSLSSTIEMVSDENTMSIVNPPEDITVDINQATKTEMPSSNEPLENSNHIENYIEPNTSIATSIESCDKVVNGEKKILSYNARKNQRKNEKMKVFTCNICKKVYTWQHDLAIHFRTHTGEKPYKCEVCDKRFAQSGAVRIHKIRHHNNSAIGRSRWKNKI